MRKRVDRLFPILLAVWILTSLVLPAWATEESTVTISNVADLQRFGKNCALDTWSQGKTVTLTADLDLSGVDFTPIPTFGGTFLGQGHTISGLCLTSAGSTQGLFRYIQPGGLVRDLTVKGTVAPGGTRSTVGGIVGNNAGTLQSCAFHGVVQGDATVGGIAGYNSITGEITGCSVSGSVSGKNITGGIAGRNLGLLLKCESSAGVNLTRKETNVDLMDADTAAILKERAAADDETYHLLEAALIPVASWAIPAAWCRAASIAARWATPMWGTTPAASPGGRTAICPAVPTAAPSTDGRTWAALRARRSPMCLWTLAGTRWSSCARS